MQPMQKPTDPAYTFNHVFDDELTQIAKQRKAREENKTKSEAPPEPLAVTKQNLVGLRFSGGGIRSATFNLGVLQALKALGLLKFVDYLSTVSGGGYIGSWFVANRYREQLRSPEERKGSGDEKPDGFLEGKGSFAINHLRRYSRYLWPEKGPIQSEYWALIFKWFANTIEIQLIVFCLLGVVLLLPWLWSGMFDWLSDNGINTFGGYGWLVLVEQGLLAAIAAFSAFKQVWLLGGGPDVVVGKNRAMGLRAVQYYITLPLMAAAALAAARIWFLVDHFLPSHREYSPWTDTLLWGVCAFVALVGTVVAGASIRGRDGISILILIFPLLTVASVAWVYLSMKTFEVMRPVLYMDSTAGRFLACAVGPSLTMVFYRLVIWLIIVIAGRCMKDEVREWWSRVGALMMIYGVAWLLLFGAALFGPVLLDWVALNQRGWEKGSTLTAGLVTLAVSLLSTRKSKTGGQEKDGWLEKVKVLGPYVVISYLVLGEATFLRWMMLPAVVKVDAFLSLNGHFPSSVWCRILFIGGILLSAGLVLIWRADLNESSMNQFYRKRPVRCFLGGARTGSERHAHPLTGFDSGDDFALGDLNAANSQGPYLLVNAALKTGQVGDLEVPEREAESFLFSQGYCGFERRNASADGGDDTKALLIEKAHLSQATGEVDAFAQGYRKTEHYIYGGKQGMSLGTVMFISGTAASQKQVLSASPGAEFLMTLFNARLGWWLPHPARDKWQEQSPKWYLVYLIKELFGSASLLDKYIYLSDGGHFENTGLYELVRRKCKLIIAGDAEEDAKVGFPGLGVAIRRCRLDFGAEIEIDVSQIRKRDKAGRSRAHCAVGTIRYADGTKGTLVYLKASLTGDEPEDLQQYHLQAPEFPNGGTGNQFFSEEQFESYRALGEHITLGAFAEKLTEAWPLDKLTGSSFAAMLMHHWSPQKVDARKFAAAKAPCEAKQQEAAR